MCGGGYRAAWSGRQGQHPTFEGDGDSSKTSGGAEHEEAGAKRNVEKGAARRPVAHLVVMASFGKIFSQPDGRWMGRRGPPGDEADPGDRNLQPEPKPKSRTGFSHGLPSCAS